MYEYVCAECGFTSKGWRTKKLASARGAEHEREHKTGKPMTELHEFDKVN